MANSDSGGPTLTLPASEQVAAEGTIAVAGASYTDGFAESNPGAMYLNIADTSGILSAFYPGSAGTIEAGGSNSITFQGSYADVDDIINSLTYAGAETTGATAITIDPGTQGASMTMADFVSPNTAAGSLPGTDNSRPQGSMMLGDTPNQPIGVSLTLPHS